MNSQKPAFKARDDFSSPSFNVRRALCAEYNRTIQEFLDTGSAAELEVEDFAHMVNPEGLGFLVFSAHLDAIHAIADWKAANPIKAAAAPEPVIEAAEEEDEAALDDLKDEDDDAAESDLLADAAALTDKDNNPAPDLPKLPVLRGETFDAEVVGNRDLTRPRPIARLSISAETRAIFRQPMAPDQTEDLLNAMIGELHFGMKEVAFRSMCQAGDLSDRMDWVNATIRMAEAGAKVADSVTGLRSGERSEGPRARSRARRQLGGAFENE